MTSKKNYTKGTCLNRLSKKQLKKDWNQIIKWYKYLGSKVSKSNMQWIIIMQKYLMFQFEQFWKLFFR